MWYYNFNAKKIEKYNIFRHYGFNNDVKKYLNKCENKEVFAHELEISLQYYFWCKSEWELIIEITENNRIILYPWIGHKEPNEVETDVTDDTDFDWTSFAKLHIDKQYYGNRAKIDVYSQVMNNWDMFLDYCWNSKYNGGNNE